MQRCSGRKEYPQVACIEKADAMRSRCLVACQDNWSQSIHVISLQAHANRYFSSSARCVTSLRQQARGSRFNLLLSATPLRRLESPMHWANSAAVIFAKAKLSNGATPQADLPCRYRINAGWFWSKPLGPGGETYYLGQTVKVLGECGRCRSVLAKM